MPPKRSRASRPKAPRKQPVKKAIPSRDNFAESDSEDTNVSLDLRPRHGSSQTLLGSHNTLKQLLAGPPSESRALVTPPRKNGVSKSKLPLSPINSASTPISRLKHATTQLSLSNGATKTPISFDDIGKESPPQKKARPGRPKDREPVKEASRSKKASTRPNLTAPRRNLTSRKPPKIEDFPDEDDSYLEQVSHHLLDLTADSDILPANNRRSSYNNRGKRGSSIGNGFVAKPHSEVPEKDYYKLLDPSMSEPNRMRQLLSWSFRKSISTEKSEDSDASGETRTAEGVAKAIELELLDDLMNGAIATSWYSLNEDTQGGDLVPGTTIVRPNPLNETNKESIEVFYNKLDSLRTEKVELLNAFESGVKSVEGLRLNQDSITEQALREYLRENQSTASTLENALDELSYQEIRSSLQQAISDAEANLELKVDKLHQVSHALSRQSGLVSRVSYSSVEPALSSLVREYKHRNDERPEPSTLDLLRGISRIDSAQSSV
ncbi:hypothetical protein OXX59_001252 [Metschnikowia pulcherrima]